MTEAVGNLAGARRTVQRVIETSNRQGRAVSAPAWMEEASEECTVKEAGSMVQRWLASVFGEDELSIKAALFSSLLPACWAGDAVAITIASAAGADLEEDVSHDCSGVTPLMHATSYILPVACETCQMP